MHVSSRSRYGLRAMLYLAVYGAGRPVPLSEVAAAEGIPAPFLERVAAGLRAAGLLTATRGVAGGYRLSRPAAEITAADVITALEGPLDLLACVRDDDACRRSPGCLSRRVWSRLDEALTGALAGVTLQDLVSEHAEPAAAPATDEPAAVRCTRTIASRGDAS